MKKLVDRTIRKIGLSLVVSACLYGSLIACSSTNSGTEEGGPAVTSEASSNENGATAATNEEKTLGVEVAVDSQAKADNSANPETTTPSVSQPVAETTPVPEAVVESKPADAQPQPIFNEASSAPTETAAASNAVATENKPVEIVPEAPISSTPVAEKAPVVGSDSAVVDQASTVASSENPVTNLQMSNTTKNETPVETVTTQSPVENTLAAAANIGSTPEPKSEAVVSMNTQEASSVNLPEFGTKMVYYIQKGDTLSEIAKKIYGSTKHVEELMVTNKIDDKNLIYSGDVLHYILNKNSQQFAMAYEGKAQQIITVQQGDNLSKIAERILGSQKEWRTLWKMNPQIKNPDLLKEGQKVICKNPSANEVAIE